MPTVQDSWFATCWRAGGRSILGYGGSLTSVSGAACLPFRYDSCYQRHPGFKRRRHQLERRPSDLKILLISFCFPPYNDVGHVRVGKLAKFLLRFGHDVQIISAKDQPFPATLPVEVSEARVLYTKWVNVNKPAELVFGGRKSVA